MQSLGGIKPGKAKHGLDVSLWTKPALMGKGSNWKGEKLLGRLPSWALLGIIPDVLPSDPDTGRLGQTPGVQVITNHQKDCQVHPQLPINLAKFLVDESARWVALQLLSILSTWRLPRLLLM